MPDEPVVTPPEAGAVEAETTEPSTSEPKTTFETEEADADTSVQPAEEGKDEIPHSQKRIQQLVKEKKAAEEETEYWRGLIEPVPETPPITDEFATADQVADTVIAKQKAEEVRRNQQKARNALQKDVAETLEAYPDLEADDDLARAVFGYAREQGITLMASANWFKARMAKEKEKAERKTTADQALKSGVSSPRGASVSKGEMPKPDISTMSEEEKASNWNEIVASYVK